MAIDTRLILYALVFCSVFLAAQTISGLALNKVKEGGARNKRQKNAKLMTPEDLVMRMRKDRGLSKNGTLESANFKLAKMVMQSGLPLGKYGIYPVILGSALVLGLLAWFFKYSLLLAVLGAGAGAYLPIFVVNFLVKRRRNKAVAQLPEALDVIVRSLKAGHPVSVAMGLVGREMGDPIGSEFGIASDEISFGAEVSAAIQRMADRIGQEDFDLFAAMIRLQERTGGNLAELLEANALTIRDRQKMRLKIKAASAEGRVSAMILNAAPVILFILVNVSAPDFYGDINENPTVKYGLMFCVFWMFVGNLVMRKMINFRI